MGVPELAADRQRPVDRFECLGQLGPVEVYLCERMQYPGRAIAVAEPLEARQHIGEQLYGRRQVPLFVADDGLEVPDAVDQFRTVVAFGRVESLAYLLDRVLEPALDPQYLADREMSPGPHLGENLSRRTRDLPDEIQRPVRLGDCILVRRQRGVRLSRGGRAKTSRPPSNHRNWP
jgi:hypothetical protein